MIDKQPETDRQTGYKYDSGNGLTFYEAQ